MDPDKKREIIRERKPRLSGDRENILVAGGRGRNSVEMFDWRQKIWSPLPSLPEWRSGATSFVYNSHVTIAGGLSGNFLDTIIGMNVESISDLATHWSKYPFKLPVKFRFHSSVVYNDQLIVTGCPSGNGAASHCMYELPLSPPYTSKRLYTIPTLINSHSSAMFDDKLLVIGGSFIGSGELNRVLLYDVKSHKYKHLAGLPYEVNSFATVKYGDNIILIGGLDEHDNELNTVVMYNVVTEQSHMLPPMKRKRSGSAAVVIGDNIVVLGGFSEGDELKAVEVFSFDSNTWNDLPEMTEERGYHTAVVV